MLIATSFPGWPIVDRDILPRGVWGGVWVVVPMRMMPVALGKVPPLATPAVPQAPSALCRLARAAWRALTQVLGIRHGRHDPGRWQTSCRWSRGHLAEGRRSCASARSPRPDARRPDLLADVRGELGEVGGEPSRHLARRLVVAARVGPGAARVEEPRVDVRGRDRHAEAEERV